MIGRYLGEEIKKKMFKGKVIVVMGARQVGKSTLVDMVLEGFRDNYKILKLNGDDSDTRTIFENPTSTKIRNIISGHKIVSIDEAQRVPEIGLVLKIMIDNFNDIQVIATGSSSFELSGKINEPLTGRKFEYTLFPLSFEEMVRHTNYLEEKRMFEQRLIFGSYPDIVNNINDAGDLLKWLTGSYLFKDIMTLENIQKPVLLEKIIKALALQVGSEVNYNEIAQLVSADNATVEKYIDLLERAFIVFKLPALAGNVRNEIKKGKKIYFVDNGIRNAVIGNFNAVHSRTDTGALFENFIISERRKYLNYRRKNVSSYFWRTTQQQEIDYIEEGSGDYSAYEFKWNPRKRVVISKTFLSNYQVVKEKVINPENFDSFLVDEQPE
ncbi:MAG TPA: ATP-binding protein [bacterium]|nr:ATP-binding protein [bacterium]HPS30268.1 ATP-binding protein [bacterium]